MLTHGERQSYQVGNFISNIMFKFSYPYELRNTRMKWPDVQVSSAAHSLPGMHLRCIKSSRTLLWRGSLLLVSSGFACTMSSAPQPRGNFCLHHYLIPGLLAHCCFLWVQERENTGCPFKPKPGEEREEEHKGEAEQSSFFMQKSCWFIHSLPSSSPLHSITLKSP